MKTNTTPNPAPKLTVCEGCGQTGTVGAKWLLYVGDSSKPKFVHKPCGAKLMAGAPEGVRVKLVPSRQLRDEWQSTRMVTNFWSNAFGNAKPLKPVAPAKVAAKPEPVVAQAPTAPVAQAA